MAPRPATRERKERFIKSFGNGAERDAVLAIFNRYGLSMLTDDQLDEIASDMADAARSSTRNHVRNRRINAAALRKVA